jgi:hypothetical protein
MTKFRFTLNILATALFMIALTSMAQAQATRTWVSGVGDDANPCSRTAPCKTFAGAISKTATGGEIDALDDGGFGTITITKSITIDGSGHLAGILSAGTTGVIVNAPTTSTVNLRNLSINGVGTGVYGVRMIAGGTLSVEKCVISGLTNHGIYINLANGAPVANLYVKDTYIHTGDTTTSRGINIQPVSGTAGVIAVIDNVRLERMFAGLYSGPGAVVSISDSEIYGMSFAGIVTESAAGNAQTNINNCVINHNGIGVQAGAGATTTRISHSYVENNTTKGFFIGGGSIISFGNNSVFGNTADDPVTTETPQI